MAKPLDAGASPAWQTKTKSLFITSITHRKLRFSFEWGEDKPLFIISLHDRRVYAGVLPRRLAGAAPFMYNFRPSVRGVTLCDFP